VIAVFGANGFIGKHVTRSLVGAGRPVVAVGRTIDADLRHGLVRAVECDLRDLDRVTEALAGVDTVIQLMGTSTPAQGNERAAENIRNDVIPHVEFLTRCTEVGVRRVVFMSSGGTIYGQVATADPVGEDTPADPISSHGATKLMVEQFIRLHGHLHDLEYVILRAANPFGPGQRFRRGQGLIPALLQRHAAGEPITIFGDGSATRDYIYIDDLVDATIRAATLPGPQQLVLNVGTGVHRSVLDVVRAIERISGIEFVVEHAPHREADVGSIALDITRAREVLGWTPTTDFEDGLARTLAAMDRTPVAG
jgi:UDP-glucose 4-epimerase